MWWNGEPFFSSFFFCGINARHLAIRVFMTKQKTNKKYSSNACIQIIVREKKTKNKMSPVYISHLNVGTYQPLIWTCLFRYKTFCFVFFTRVNLFNRPFTRANTPSRFGLRRVVMCTRAPRFTTFLFPSLLSGSQIL